MVITIIQFENPKLSADYEDELKITTMVRDHYGYGLPKGTVSEM